MFGLESAGVGVLKFVFLVELWMLHNNLMLHRIYPNGHCFMQDNDSKHTSKCAQQFFQDDNINWWRTPPESPDANPIENLWHELKAYYYVLA